MVIDRWLFALPLLLLTAGCSDQPFNFSQYPGFAAWYAENPPSSSLPTPEQTALLERYQPRVFVPDGHEGPIDFYRDYVAQGILTGDDGQPISKDVDPVLLNDHKSDPAVVFTHQPTGEAPMPVMYARIAEEPIDWPGCSAPINLTFLTYHLVFRSSGLPADLPAWQAAGLWLIADLDDWHQLDHYTAVTVTLAPARQDRPRPIAATFQQHNYQRTYLLDRTADSGRLTLPDDDRLPVDIAVRSNELYPHVPGRTARRAVSFMDPESAAYMVADGPAPWLAADDITDPAREIELPLTYLPPDDAFYTFKGWLGERRRLPGRDGPPGADYNTLPAMKPLVNQLALSFWQEGDRAWLALFQDLFKDGRPERIDPNPFIARLADDIAPAC